MPLVDMHAHIFPDAIAVKAAASTGAFYDIPMCHNGTVAQLLEMQQAYHMTHFVIHSVATKASQVESINDFLARETAQHPQLFTPFAAMHPDYTHIAQEIDRVIAMGFRGIKLHPDIQGFAVDDPQAFRIYEAMEGRLPLLVHTGDNRHFLSDPARMARVLDHFPRLTAICAHLGGWSQWEKAQHELVGRENVYVDTSSSLYALDPLRAREMIRAFGVDHVFFGTDYPMWDCGEELRRIDALGLEPWEKEAILHGNAEKFLGLETDPRPEAGQD